MTSSISAVPSLSSAAMTAAKSKVDLDKLAQNANVTDADNDAKIEKTAHDFEAVFITQMLKPMMDSVKVDPIFGGGRGEEVFRDFTLNEYGKKLANNGGFGIAKHVKAELLRMQEEAKHGKSAASAASALSAAY